MADWTAGYVADIGYTYGYYAELNPIRSRLALLNAKLTFPEIQTACELGFGQGLSTNIHAAASATQWYGTDFNPSQAAFAQELAAKAGAGTKLWDEAFADFAHRSDLPDFDFIGLHGIWSWISDSNRTVIVDFIRRKLKVGGVLYISYNTLPGWASFAPIRHLMTEHAGRLGAEGSNIVDRIDDAIDFAGRLLKTNPLFASANPQIADRIEKLKGQDRHYLAHEYFNRDWHPMHFGTMAEWLAPAKVSYACSAHYPDHVNAINLTAEQQAFLNEVSDPIIRESVRDFMVNQQFRRDYWVKGPRTLAPLAHAEALRAQRVVLIPPRDKVSLTVKGPLGDGNMSASIYNPILDTLADRKPKSLGQIEKELAGHPEVRFSHILEAALLLGGTCAVVAVQDDAVIAKARKQTERLNATLIDRARSSSDINHLACPLTGSGINVLRFHQLFLYALTHGRKTPAEWAEMVWDIISVQGHKLVREGVTLESKEDNLAQLAVEAELFAREGLPGLKALGVI